MAGNGETDNAGLSSEARAGLMLLAAALFALAIANSPLQGSYFVLLTYPVTFGVTPLAISKPVLLWINDGLMAIFFFLVGLEIKREFLTGALSNRKSAALPLIAALGGMIVPALIYTAINWGDAAALRGWAIPAATDIAFAVGVLALLGSRVPPALKVFLLALAIMDDLGAIVIIAIFYTSKLSVTALALAAAGLAVLATMNRFKVHKVLPYLLAGLFVWVCVLKSGVHATLAGVATAIAIPIAAPVSGTRSLLDRLEHSLAPWVNFGILPVFAFANAGVALGGVSVSQLLGPVPLGIALGLFAGKAVGIYGFASAAIAGRAADMPAGASHMQLFGAAVLGGIGFTMSLFIGTLAFPDPASAADLRIGVLAGSLLSALTGYFILSRSKPS